MNIHPTALIDPGAELDQTVSVGPYTVIGSGVRIGARTEIGAHCTLSGPTLIGEGNKIGPFATVGAPPQDLKYKGEPTELIIGNDNVIREYVSIHRGTASGLGHTRIGDQCLLMAYVHIAHDCTLGNGVIMANAVTLAGHVSIEDRSIIGGLTAIQQFVRVGTFAYIGGMSGLSKDVPPYVVMAGIRKQMRISGINHIGLRRAGCPPENIRGLQAAFKIIFRTPELLLQEALDHTLAQVDDCAEVRHLVGFFRTSRQGVLRQVGEDDD
ncbi:acyl-ACP--UDP-N-acetylglucosamine O-acyltransferase [Desulfurivibrio sp. C05AmB]|jgi:UDP-N-acetylglucosamine acyltransferase|uniref:acyl-ACP--UDP-N-acetylglucosamine O-acyltransferase n=1 Tax=Desulfurivibrio sp. C05AmB TaxID=3374371 RepID=UPI00376ED903